MADPFANLNIDKPLVQKWMKKGNITRRRNKLRQMNRGEEPNSPITPGASEPPHTKRAAESMYNGRLQYLAGFIVQANPKEMNTLRKRVFQMTDNSAQKKDSVLRLLGKFRNNNNSAKNRNTRNRNQELAKDTILYFITEDHNHTNTKSASLFNIIYDALPDYY